MQRSLFGLFTAFGLFAALPAFAASVTGYNGVTVSVDATGAYSITLASPAWHFGGSVGFPVSNLTVAPGTDNAGAFQEISFDFKSDAQRHAAIRAYAARPVVLFSVTGTSAAPNSFNFPSLKDYPQGLDHLAFTGVFALPAFSVLTPESPWMFFDASANTFILSPAGNFMTSSNTKGTKGELISGVDSQIATLPQGFSQQTVLVIEKGINKAFDAWGDALTTLHGKTRPANDADRILERVGYWTDRGAPYYYQTADSMTYEQTLAAVKGDFDHIGMELGYVQLDSWFYPKGPGAVWIDNGNGIAQYTADPKLFPDGLASFQKQLGAGLITHARWIDFTSPYRTTYKMSGNVITDPLYWARTAEYLANAGVAAYEQDWLGDKASTDFNLTDPDAFLDNMAAAMAAHNITMQYCMATARHFLQTSKYNNVTTIRTSNDRLDSGNWSDFLYGSRLASALGIWPFTDNFQSTETENLLLATLSAGPLGIADPVGGIASVNLLHSARRDGILVKPDVAMTPVDRSFGRMAHNIDTPQVNATYTDFNGLRTHYAFAYAVGSNLTAELSTSDFGADAPVYLYDYFAGTGRIVKPTDALKIPIAGKVLFLVAAPIGPSGMAILGDLDHYVGTGKKRITKLTDNGAVHMAIAFAAGEQSRTITGYSPVEPSAIATKGSINAVSYDSLSQRFQIQVAPGASGSASISIHKQTRKIPAAQQ